MDISLNATLNASQALQQLQTSQQQQNTLLRKALDNQSNEVTALLKGMPTLATSGSVGTQLHVTA